MYYGTILNIVFTVIAHKGSPYYINFSINGGQYERPRETTRIYKTGGYP